jgi:hypothetical protein
MLPVMPNRRAPPGFRPHLELLIQDGGLISALATSRIRVVAAAIALSSTSGLGQGVAGSWLPGSA